MQYLIIGTAGHIDHGKTTLVKALTGQETDRLKEEKERGISIELGFASFELSSGQKVGVVDVPGHERFIRQMLAGVAGIDLVLLIVAADEGVMPQTREHLDIISLLNVKKGIVVLTKLDLVEPDWLELVQEDIQELLADTPISGAPIVTASAKTGAGIAELKELIAKELAGMTTKPAEGRSRMPIDRVFSVAGFGTVVTGTLWNGVIKVGEKLVVYPDNLEAKVRNIQVHGEQVEEAQAGQRVAVNLGNTSLEEVSRGDVLAAANMLLPSFRMEVELVLLPGATQPLSQRQRVRVHLGTAEVLGRINLLDREELMPGDNSLAQIVLEKEIVALRGDRFVIRSYSPMVTIGGGTVIDPVAKKVKRYREDVLERMQVKLAGSPEEKLFELIREKPFVAEKELAKLLNYDIELVKTSIGELEKEGQVKCLSPGNLLLTTDKVAEYTHKAEQMIGKYHQEFPLRTGMSKEELRTKMGGEISQKIFVSLLENWLEQGKLTRAGDKIAMVSHQPAPSILQEKQLAMISKLLTKKTYQPPIKKELAGELKLEGEEIDELLQYLISHGEIIKISEEIYFPAAALKLLQEVVAGIYQEKGEIILGDVRDATGSSRKYILPMLEYLDQIKYTKRIGDKRVLY